MKRILKKIFHTWKIQRQLQANYHFISSNPYIYKSENYPDSFLSKVIKQTTFIIDKNPVPRKIYTFWTGNNPMSESRQSHFELLKLVAGVEVVLITPNNLSEYILPEYPLHHAFKYLSLVHKADYLRCYFMHHYGGGYSDIKAAQYNWSPVFDTLDCSNAYFIGYPEIKAEDLAPVEGKIGEDMQCYFSIIAGNCAYIFRKQTPFTQEWYNELLNRMDNYAEQLENNPGNVLGNNPGYPIPWTNILGDIFHPLCLKYTDKILLDNTLRPNLENYR